MPVLQAKLLMVIETPVVQYGIVLVILLKAMEDLIFKKQHRFTDSYGRNLTKALKLIMASSCNLNSL